MPGTTLKGAHLSFQQERLWQFQQDGAPYRAWCTIAINGRLNSLAFEQALQQTVAQHSIFQTLFYPLPGMDIPVQVIGHHVDFCYPVINLEQLALPAQDAQLKKLLALFQEQAFDLQHGPLFRPALFRLAQERSLLLICLPALYADGPTLPLLTKELIRRYREQVGTGFIPVRAAEAEQVGTGFISVPAAELPEELPYTAISAWQRQQVEEESEESNTAHNFWQKVNWARVSQMQRDFAQIGIITQNTQRSTFQPMTFHLSIDDTLLQELAARYSVSAPVILLTCWLVVLHRLTANPQVGTGFTSVLGVARHGRNYEELTEALGPLTRFVPLEIALQNTWSFAQSLSFVEPLLEATEEYQDYFSWPATFPDSPTSTGPGFFPIIFEHEQWPTSFADARVHFQFTQRVCWNEPFFLKLSVLQVGESIQVELDYDASNVSAIWVNQLASLLQTLLRSVAEQPQTQLDKLPLLAAEQHSHLLTAFSGERRSWPDQRLHLLFEEHVRLQPSALAVISRQEQMTYQQLNAHANQLAHVLRRRGVGPDVLVGLCLSRQASMLVGLLGILKAGGAYLPLDTNNPGQRLHYQLQESGTCLLLTQQVLRDALPDWDGHILYLEELAEELAQASPDDLQVQNQPEHLAYVIYTSGSTGAPKGVMISQRNVVNYTYALCEQLGAEAGWQYATVSTLAADLGNTAIFCALASGGTVQVLDHETVTSGEAMIAWAEQHPIDVLKVVPSHLSVLLEHARAGLFLPRRALVLGGEALPVQLMARLRTEINPVPTCQIYNHYGPTETTIGVLVNSLGTADGERLSAHTSVALGRPIANAQAYILDPHLQLVPPGITGELYIGGAGVARGYLAQPGQTAERFIPHPYSKIGGARLYRTGDLARYGEKEQIEFVGRQDGQVKLRGYRIEVEEIAAALRQHPLLRDCVVMLREDLHGGPHLVAYLTPKKWPLPAGTKIRGFLQERLPDYMIPTVFIDLKFLPLTANGKIDRRQLIAASSDGRHHVTSLLDANDEARTIIQPRDLLEMQLLQIWENILQFQPVSIVDNFFDIGGHSLLAVQLISQIAEHCGRNLDLATLFRCPTIAELAVVLRQQQQIAEEEQLLAAIQTQGTRPPFFCVHPAGGMAFCYITLSRCLGPDQPFYGLHAPLGASRGGKEKTASDTIEEMAARYIAAIQTLQPQGPYLLGGWSLGGVIAFEMAQQLQRQGHEVAVLAIIDSAISTPQERDDALARTMDLSDAGVVREFTRVAKIPVPDGFAQRTLEEQLSYATEQAKAAHVIPADTSVDLVRIYTRARIMTKYSTHIYTGSDYTEKIDYFLSDDRETPDDTVGAGLVSAHVEAGLVSAHVGTGHGSVETRRLRRWHELARGGLEIHHVPGNHSEILENPNVEVLAKALKQCIDKVCALTT